MWLCHQRSTLPPLSLSLSPSLSLSGKYGYQYIEAGQGEGEFVSRVGQRNMLKDIIKQEIVIGEGGEMIN